MNMVAEGIDTCKSVRDLSIKSGVETPIVNEVYKVLFEDKDAIQATTDLMARDMKPE